MIIGLTGGSGTGKTELSRLFEKAGYVVINYDELTYRVYEKGSPCLGEIREAFGDDIIAPDGSILRRRLGEIVFADREALLKLNSIVYKYLLALTDDILADNEGRDILLDAPTLFEANLDKRCDKIIGVIAAYELRVSRIQSRDKLSVEVAANRIKSQKSDDFYRENCDYIIDNSGGIDDLKNQALKIIGSISK